MYEDPGPANCVEGVKNHHHGLGVPVFLFLVYKGVFSVEDEGLVGFVSFGRAVDCSGGGECSVGDDLAESHGLIVFGGGMFVPHPDNDLLGTNDDLLREGFGVACICLVVCQELLVDALGPCLGNLVVCGVSVVDGAGVKGKGVGVGSLLFLAALKSSRHMCHAAMKHACNPLRRSLSGKWIFFSGVP